MTGAQYPKPEAHPTRWTLVFEDGLCLYESQSDAEAELRRAQARGDRAYILPPTLRGPNGPW
jgi:hypothetical protein